MLKQKFSMFPYKFSGSCHSGMFYKRLPPGHILLNLPECPADILQFCTNRLKYISDPVIDPFYKKLPLL